MGVESGATDTDQHRCYFLPDPGARMAGLLELCAAGRVFLLPFPQCKDRGQKEKYGGARSRL